MISQIRKRGRKFDEPAITMLRLHVVSSQKLTAGGSELMYSDVCHVHIMNRSP